MKLPRIEEPLPSWKAEPPPPPLPPVAPIVVVIMTLGVENAQLACPRVHATRTGSRSITPDADGHPDCSLGLTPIEYLTSSSSWRISKIRRPPLEESRNLSSQQQNGRGRGLPSSRPVDPRKPTGRTYRTGWVNVQGSRAAFAPVPVCCPARGQGRSSAAPAGVASHYMYYFKSSLHYFVIIISTKIPKMVSLERHVMSLVRACAQCSTTNVWAWFEHRNKFSTNICTGSGTPRMGHEVSITIRKLTDIFESGHRRAEPTAAGRVTPCSWSLPAVEVVLLKGDEPSSCTLVS